jgi:hypothetical protein
MQNGKLIGIVVLAVTIFGITISGDYLYAEKKETNKLGEKALAPRYEIEETFICPHCKEGRISPEKGRTLAMTTMVCPECEDEISEVVVHRCDICGEDVLECVLCSGTSAELQAAAAIKSICPECREERVRPIKGRTLAKWEMQCPECKKTSREWLIIHCDTCNKDVLACPLCKREQEKSVHFH